jgi:segregation and condensation protein B
MPRKADRDDTSDTRDALELGRAAATQIGAGEWQLDTEDLAALEQSLLQPEPPPPEPIAEAVALPEPMAPQPRAPALRIAPQTVESPPSPEQLLESMLFVGGHPLTAEIAMQAVRGLTHERFQSAIDSLNRRYRDQQRPYSAEPRGDGYVLVVKSAFRQVRDRLFGGPREARLSQPALDVLSVVAYRQPVGKLEIDAIRGTDSGATLRQLVRLGLIAVQHRADSAGREVRYGTTPRFLQVFGLSSLDELPRLGDSAQV